MRRKLIVFQMVLALLLIVTGSTSYATKATTIRGKIQSDKVELKASLKDETGEITPGERAKQILTISNLGTDCYIRVTPKLKENSVSIEELDYDCNKDWVLKNGSYYYTKIFPKDKSVEFCESILVPSGITSKEISLDYGIDAIQSDNFNPEFTSLNPWGNVEVIGVKTRREGVTVNSVGAKFQDTDSLEIHYNEEAKSLILNFDEIFKDIPLMKPGDNYSEEIKLKNSGKSAKTLYLSDITDSAEILKYIDISITSSVNGDKKEIYKGNLGESQSGKTLNVGTLLPNEEGSLVISANMSKLAGNEASSLSTHLTLEAWAEDSEGEIEEIGSIVENTEKKNLEVRSAKTGDDLNVYRLMIIAGCMLAAGVFLVKKRG